MLGGVALLVGAILLFAGLHLGTPQFHAVTYFKGSVAGLDVGAPVTFRGVRVGSVTRIGLNIDLKDLSARIPVELDVDASRVSLGGPDDDDTKKTFLRLRRAGLQAQLSLQSLISGQLAVDLDLRPGVRPNWVGYPLAANEIPSSPSKLETLEAEIAALPLKQIADQSLQTLQSIHHVSDQLGTRVGPMADSLTRTSEAAHETLDEAKVAAAHIDSLAVTGQAQLATNGDQLHRVLVASDKTARDADALVASLNEMTAPNARMRDDLLATTRDLAASASALRGFSQEIERNPSSLLRKGKPQ